MGGKDVIYIKQQHSSNLQPADIQKRLKDMADKRFLDANGHYSMAPEQVFQSDKVCNRTVNDCFKSVVVYLDKLCFSLFGMKSIFLVR